MKQKAVKLLLGVLIVGTMVVLAFWVGNEVRQVLAEPDHQKLLERREQMTKGILKQMESIQDGDTLSDYEFFETLESETVKLSNVVNGPTWLVFMLPDCQECLEELDQLKPVLDNTDRETQLILISSGNPLDLLDIRNHYNLKIPILHDRNATYTEAVKVFTFPFNILIDSSLTIKRVIAGHLEPEDF